MWLKYFEQYAVSQLPALLEGKPWNYKNDICISGLNKLAKATVDEKWNQSTIINLVN